ncbi:MAG: metallophosphoesterase [Planctomycetota bacterium]|jgi:predicted MPP superfamily phosphohydrolase
MNLFFFSLFVLTVFVVPDVIWWRWADRRVRETRWARIAVAVFVVTMMVFPVTLLLLRKVALRSHEFLPMEYVAATFIWHFLLLPASLIVAFAVRKKQPTVESRRRFLAGAIALAPPVLTGIGVGISIPRLKDVRLREIDVPLAGLPRALDGLVIAHITDPHFGKFTVERSVDRAVELTNSIEADLVLGTGDLIDLSTRDLPQAIDFLERIDPRGGHFWCEGNHDLIDDGARFHAGMNEAGFPVLHDDRKTLEIRGEKVQIVGASWGQDPAEAPSADPDAFGILLAHHPHAFDYDTTFSLVLSGHTHGGQLMLNEQLGAGPVLFRYWSGLYTSHGRALVVNNGIGHWFPLRTAAPAEVMKLTLRRIPSAKA